MDFANLTNVGNAITVRSRPEEDSSYYSTSLVLGSNPPLAIDFPSLVNCSNVEIVGNISRFVLPPTIILWLLERLANCLASISAPKLATIGDFTGNSLFYTSYYDGLKVNTQGSPLDLKFPSLWNTSRVAVAGTIAKYGPTSSQYG